MGLKDISKRFLKLFSFILGFVFGQEDPNPDPNKVNTD